MGIRKYKPTSAGRRNASVSDFATLTPGSKREKSLLRPLPKKGGRNNQGKITVRHRGGGHKRQYRVIDFTRNKEGVPARVASIQYDPNRSSRIALLHYVDGEKRYIIAPDGLTAGDLVEAGPDAPPTVGNALPLKSIPLGTAIHWERRFTTSRCSRGAVASCAEVRALVPRSWHAKRVGHSCRCPAARSVACRRPVRRR